MTQKNGAVEPDVNEIFKEMYSAVTVAVSANENEAKFWWMNNTKPFPIKKHHGRILFPGVAMMKVKGSLN